MSIIALFGQAGVGKSTLAKVLVNTFNAGCWGFTRPFKHGPKEHTVAWRKNIHNMIKQHSLEERMKLWKDTAPKKELLIVDDARMRDEYFYCVVHGYCKVLLVGPHRYSFLHPGYWHRAEREVRWLARHGRFDRIIHMNNPTALEDICTVAESYLKGRLPWQHLS